MEVKYSVTMCNIFYLLPLEGSKRFSVEGIPLPGHSTSASQGHWSLSSKAYDWSSVVVHEEQR